MMVGNELAYSFFSKNNQRIWVRPIQAEDAPLLVNVFNHMTPESRYKRFHQTLDNVPDSRVWQEAENIAHANPQLNRGLLAFADSQEKGLVPVGAVRIVELNPQEAEVAISIRDDYQNQGIGSHIMRLMAEEAQKLGYHKLVADIQNDNVAILKIFQGLPYDMQRLPQGSSSEITIRLA